MARIPTESIPALAAGLEEKFKNWGDPDEHAALAEKLLEIHRIATLLAEMREPEAEEVLNRFTASSPCLATKKIFFLAAKQRARFLRRVGDKHAPI